MYAWDFPQENGMNNAIGPGEQVESPRQQDQGRLRNEVSWSDWVQRVGVPERTEWSGSFGAVFIRAMHGGDYDIKIVSS